MAETRKKYLFKNTLIFTLGNLGSKFITFFLIPLYTNCLTTAQYGTADLVSTVCTFAIPILTLNINEAVMRFGLDKDKKNIEVTRVGCLLFFISIIAGLFIIPLCSQFEQLEKYCWYIYLYVISLGGSQIFLCDLRGKELLKEYAIGNVLKTFFVAFLNIVFLLFLNMGIEGYLLAFIISNLLISIYAFTIGKGYASLHEFKINKKLLCEMVKYSAVLIPTTFMWWIINSSDRVMIATMIGAAANGVYAISYKLPSLVSSLTTIFNQAWNYSAIREEGKSDEEDYNNKVFSYLTSFVMFIAISLLTFTKPFLMIYVTKDFFEAWRYSSFLILGFVYQTLGTFMATSYTVHKDSLGYLFSGSFGAICNIGLNFLLIPRIGVYGAAIATMVSYISVFVFRYFHTQKYIHYRIGTKEFVLGTIIILVSAPLMYLDNLIGFAAQIVLYIITIYFYGKKFKPVLIGIVKRFKRKESA